MKIGREGLNIITFEPEGDFEYEWLVLNTDAEPYQWIGRTLAVDTGWPRRCSRACAARGGLSTSPDHHRRCPAPSPSAKRGPGARGVGRTTMKLASIILIIMTAGCIAETEVDPIDSLELEEPPCDAGADVEPSPRVAIPWDWSMDDDRCAGVPSGVPATPQLLGPCIIERCTASGDAVPTNAPAGTPCGDGGDGACDGSGVCAE